MLGFSSFPSKRRLLFTSRANSLNFSTFHVSELSYLNNYVVMSPVLLFISLLSVPWSYFEPVCSWRQMVGVRRPTSRCHAPVWWWRHWRRFTVVRSNSHQCCKSEFESRTDVGALLERNKKLKCEIYTLVGQQRVVILQSNGCQ